MEMEKARGIEEESNPILRLGNKLEFQRHFLQNWARSLRCRDGYGEGNRQTFREILELQEWIWRWKQQTLFANSWAAGMEMEIWKQESEDYGLMIGVCLWAEKQ